VSYHISNLGAWAPRRLLADVEGYIHTTPLDVLAGRWEASDEAMTSEQADEVAETNRRATDAAHAAQDSEQDSER